VADEQDDDAPLPIALRDLVLSDGWRWLCQQADLEAGPAAYGKRINAAIAAIPAGPNREFEVSAAIDKIHASCEAVNALIAKPKEMLQRLTETPKKRPFEGFRRTLETHR